MSSPEALVIFQELRVLSSDWCEWLLRKIKTAFSICIRCQYSWKCIVRTASHLTDDLYTVSLPTFFPSSMLGNAVGCHFERMRQT